MCLVYLKKKEPVGDDDSLPDDIVKNPAENCNPDRIKVQVTLGDNDQMYTCG